MKHKKQVDADAVDLRAARQRGVLDQINTALGLKSQADLARVLEVQPAVVSKLLKGTLPISSNHLILIHELMEDEGIDGWSIRQIKAKLGLPRRG